MSQAVREALRVLVGAQGPILDIAEGALLLGALDRPGVALAPYRRHLAELAHETGDRAAPERINELLFARHGYVGDTETYDDLRNANLTHVVDRRRGLPVALCILYMHAARAAGLAAFGLNLPGHVMIAVGKGDALAVRDPFNGGRKVGVEELERMVASTLGPGAEVDLDSLRPMDDRAVLLRLHNNIKVRALRDEDVDRAASTLEAMVIVAPDQAAVWRELGEVQARRDNLRAASAAFERARTLAASAGEARAIELELRSLRGRLN